MVKRVAVIAGTLAIVVSFQAALLVRGGALGGRPQAIPAGFAVKNAVHPPARAQHHAAPLAVRREPHRLRRSISPPRHLPPPGPPPTRYGDVIEVSIEHQTLTAWRDGAVVMHTFVSTARPGYVTPRGHFRVLSKTRNGWSSKWKVVMPWAMQFYRDYLLHQITHRPGSTQLIGASRIGHPASHGCVRLGVGFAERLYRWAHVGTPVWVH